jgi:uncharacterized protein (DUF488 family)
MRRSKRGSGAGRLSSPPAEAQLDDAPDLEWAVTVFTIGHSTHPIDEFIGMLQQAGVTRVIDVRSIPRSRTNPQFNTETLHDSLTSAGIGYLHMPALGGRRHRPKGAPPSQNLLWRHQAFRNYADYALTEAFRGGLDQLESVAKAEPCAIMCSEAVWWRCHRRIISDYLLADGVAVAHIMGPGKIDPATLTPGARKLPDGHVIYEA